MEKLCFPYRSAGHLGLLCVVEGSGSWRKYGLDVDCYSFISAADAHRRAGGSDAAFVSGNHITPYAERAKGNRWVYLGQTVNLLNHKLAVSPTSGIAAVADLRGRRVVIPGQHPGLNTWLFLKQSGLDADKGEVLLTKGDRKSPPWEQVLSGHADATFLTSPDDLLAKRAGLKVIDLPRWPMIWFTTISTSMPFVQKHPDTVVRFIKGLVAGIAFFKTRKAEAIKIMGERLAAYHPVDRELLQHLYRELNAIVEPKPYPSLVAIDNVYELAKREHRAAAKVNPLTLWDLHFLRELDDSGFIDRLYQRGGKG